MPATNFLSVPKKSEFDAVAEIERRLVTKFAAVPPADVSTAISQAHDRFADSKIRDFVPLLVERRVISQLSALSRV